VETKLEGGAADKVIGKLLSQHLVEEIPAQVVCRSGGAPIKYAINIIDGESSPSPSHFVALYLTHLQALNFRHFWVKP
jgi:hypothetical protein